MLLNGIAINDQSVTDGLHDFGQDFVQPFNKLKFIKVRMEASLDQVLFSAVNFITDIDYTNTYSVNGFLFQNHARNNSVNGNYSKIPENGWHLNLKGTTTQSETNSAIVKE